MNDTTQAPTTNSTHKPVRVAWLILVLAVKLMLITAMQNQTISEFIYQGF